LRHCKGLQASTGAHAPVKATVPRTDREGGGEVNTRSQDIGLSVLVVAIAQDGFLRTRPNFSVKEKDEARPALGWAPDRRMPSFSDLREGEGLLFTGIVPAAEPSFSGWSLNTQPAPQAPELLKDCYMRRMKCLVLVSSLVLYRLYGAAGTLLENFSVDPASAGWRTFGDTNLFVWDTTQENLKVTWDSSRSNSYFYHPLGTILAREDDFSFEFDLRLLDITTTTKSGPFEIAVSLLNFTDASRADFWRGSGVNDLHGPRNIVEFDYFPAGYYPGFGAVDPSISPALVSKDNGFAAGFDLLELTNGALFHIRLDYTASNTVLHTTMTCNGAAFGPVNDVALGTNFTDFHLDTVAVASYSDAGDDFDSVLAHGVLDNLVVRTPLPPVQQVAGNFANGLWQVQFITRSNWVYTVERSTNFQSWETVSAAVAGDGAEAVVQDRNAPPGACFYRVRAQRP
jgi:hypothetical protein